MYWYVVHNNFRYLSNTELNFCVKSIIYTYIRVKYWHTHVLYYKHSLHTTDRKNVADFLYLVLHLAGKVTCYFQWYSSVLVSVLRTSIHVLSKSKSKYCVTWIANLTKSFLSVYEFAILQPILVFFLSTMYITIFHKT